LEANARHAELLLAGKIETHYKRDPENSLFAKMCALTAAINGQGPGSRHG
jgi:hypothetical protein